MFPKQIDGVCFIFEILLLRFNFSTSGGNLVKKVAATCTVNLCFFDVSLLCFATNFKA